MSVLENQWGLHPGEPWSCREQRDSTLKWLEHRLTYPLTHYKSSCLKSTQIPCEGDSFTNLTSICQRDSCLLGLFLRMETLMVVIFTFSLYLTRTKAGEHHFCTLFFSPASACGCIPPLHDTHSLAAIPASVAPAKVAGICSWYRGCPLSAWLSISEARDDCIQGHQKSEIIGEIFLGRLQSPRHCTDRIKYTVSAWRVCFRITKHLKASGSVLRECSLGNAIFALSLDLAAAFQYLPERNSYTHLEP